MITPLGKFLRSIRIEQNELLYDMATKLGISSSKLASIEHGKEYLDDDLRKKLFDTYPEITPDILHELEASNPENKNKKGMTAMSGIVEENGLAAVHTTSYMEYKRQSKEITDFTHGGQCSGCGNCCPNMLPITESEIKRIKSYVRTKGIKPHQINFPLSGPMVDATCPFLNNNKTERCNIYPVRPSICRCFICNSQETTIQNALESGITEKRNVTDMRSTFFPKQEDDNSVNYKGYTAIQASNNHVSIIENVTNHTVLHAQCNEPKTKQELRDMIDFYITDLMEGE